MAILYKQTLILLPRFLICGVFIAAGVGKLMNPGSFFQELSHYEILPDPCLVPATWFLPTLEIVTGGCLLADYWTREACLLLIGLLSLFTLAILSAWVRGLNIECGCFGDLGNWGSYPIWIVRNCLLGIALRFVFGSHSLLDKFGLSR